jgi:hypothetical protein
MGRLPLKIEECASYNLLSHPRLSSMLPAEDGLAAGSTAILSRFVSRSSSATRWIISKSIWLSYVFCTTCKAEERFFRIDDVVVGDIKNPCF